MASADVVREWRLAMSTYMLGVADTLDDLTAATVDPLAVLADEPTRVRVAYALARLQQCTRDLDANVGPAPTEELETVKKLMRQACRDFKTAAAHIAEGIDAGDPAVVSQAADELERGTALFHDAQDELAGLSFRLHSA